MDAIILQEASHLACKHLSIDYSLTSTDYQSIDEIVEAITPKVSEMINNDMEGLLNALYRIDVDEDKFKRLLSTELPDKIALSLSRLIVERELKKAATRVKYKNKS